MQKTFLLGVGAQKAGTTWLYEYLRRHPQCNMGTIKEYAVFNSFYMPEQFGKRPLNRLQNLSRRAGKLAEQGPDKATDEERRNFLDRLDEVALGMDLSRYVPHFDRLYSAVPGVRVVGDITPEYSALEAEHFREIKDLLEAGGYQVKVVFLMRDPVERCYSAIRMHDRNADKSTQRKFATLAHERFAREAVRPWCEIRTRYEKTIPAIERVFAPEDIFYGIYENFIAPGPVRDLTDFLGLAPVPPNLEHRVNVSPREHDLEPGAVARVREHYRDTYDFCRDRFGAALIDKLWLARS